MLIGVIIHEVGHNFFPMIVNSDERQWGWMDEGMNTFLEYLAEQEWSRKFGERNGPAYSVIDYMKGDKIPDLSHHDRFGYRPELRSQCL